MHIIALSLALCHVCSIFECTFWGVRKSSLHNQLRSASFTFQVVIIKTYVILYFTLKASLQNTSTLYSKHDRRKKLHMSHFSVWKSSWPSIIHTTSLTVPRGSFLSPRHNAFFIHQRAFTIQLIADMLLAFVL